MLAVSTVMEIDRLLQEGFLSQRQIAKRLGVSRGTVGAIASGQRPLVGKEPPEQCTPIISDRGQPRRCPRCGHHVYLPCQICRANSFIDAKRPWRAVASESTARRETPGKLPTFPSRQAN